jgi:hypothetical protein
LTAKRTPKQITTITSGQLGTSKRITVSNVKESKKACRRLNRNGDRPSINDYYFSSWFIGGIGGGAICIGAHGAGHARLAQHPWKATAANTMATIAAIFI